MSERDAVDLYIWMRRLFPPDADPDTEGAHVIDTREMVAELRGRILVELRDRATFAARDALLELAEKVGDSWIRWHAVDADRLALEQTWCPPGVLDLIRLAANSRIAHSASHLLDIILESIARFQLALQGETPEVQFLWDTQANRTERPKGEEAFSNYLAKHLERDIGSRAIVINREVEIRTRRGDRPGEETDIHVDAFGGDGQAPERLRVIIEAKGNWNRELDTSIDSQLAERYLRDSQCCHGVYVVGCFWSEKWDPTDGRRKTVAARSIGSTRSHLEARASALSTGRIRVEAVIVDAKL